MRFLNSKFNITMALKPKIKVLEQSETLSEDTLKCSFENTLSAPTPTNLMSKFCLNPITSSSEPPEAIYENEAWAPKTELIGLFRKHRSLPSDASL